MGGIYVKNDALQLIVAVLNTANIYGPREFTPNEVLTACGNWGANGLNTWALPSKCNGKIDTSNYTHGGKEQATVFSAVKASIEQESNHYFQQA